MRKPAVPLSLLVASGLLLATPLSSRGQEPALARPATPPVAQDDPLRLAEGLVARGFHDLARKELNAVLAQKNDAETAARARLLLIECLRVQGKTDEALTEIDRFTQAWPTHPRLPTIQLVRGEMLARQGKLDAAITCLTPLATATEPSVRDGAQYRLALATEAAGKPDDAARWYAQLQTETPAAERPYIAYALLAEGQFHAQRGDVASAVAAWTRLGDAAGAADTLRAEAVYRIGEYAFNRSDFPTAIAADERLLREWPRGNWAAEANRRLAWSLFSQKQYTEAQTQIQRWASVFPNAGVEDRLLLSAMCLAGNGNLAGALAKVEETLSRPQLPEAYARSAWRQRVAWLLALERRDDVVRQARAFAEAHPHAAEQADIDYFAGEALCRDSKWADAAAFLHQALAAAPPSWPFWGTAPARLELALRSTGQLSDAAAMYQVLAERAELPGRAGFLLKAGQLRREDGETAAAIAVFKAVRARFPDLPEAVGATIEQAQAEADNGAYANAEQVVQELLSKLPPERVAERDRLRLFLGFLAFRRQEYSVAVERFRELAIGPPVPAAEVRGDATLYLAAALLESGKEPEALPIFADLLRAADQPQWPDALLLRIEELFVRHTQLAAADAACQQLLRSTNPETVARARLRYAELLLTQGRLKDARAQLAPLLKDGGAPGLRQDAAALDGDLLLAEGHADQAALAFAAALAPPSPARGAAGARARYGLAAIQFKDGRLELALEQAVHAYVLENDPVFTPQAMMLAVRALQKLGRPKEAAITWQELQQRFPVTAERFRDDPAVRALLSLTVPTEKPRAAEKEK